MAWVTPTTDRTKQDENTLAGIIYRIKYGGASTSEITDFVLYSNKGAINYTDLNRIIGNITYLNEALPSAYRITQTTYGETYNQNTEDIKANKIHFDIVNLRQAYVSCYGFTPAPSVIPTTFVHTLGMEYINNWETVLFWLYIQSDNLLITNNNDYLVTAEEYYLEYT